MTLEDKVSQTLEESAVGKIPKSTLASVTGRHRQRVRRRVVAAIVVLVAVGGTGSVLVATTNRSSDVIVADDAAVTDSATSEDLTATDTAPSDATSESGLRVYDVLELHGVCLDALEVDAPPDLTATVSPDGSIDSVTGTRVAGDERYELCRDIVNRSRPEVTQWTATTTQGSQRQQQLLADGGHLR